MKSLATERRILKAEVAAMMRLGLLLDERRRKLSLPGVLKEMILGPIEELEKRR